jgi:hypothetical protein
MSPNSHRKRIRFTGRLDSIRQCSFENHQLLSTMRFLGRSSVANEFEHSSRGEATKRRVSRSIAIILSLTLHFPLIVFAQNDGNPGDAFVTNDKIIILTKATTEAPQNNRKQLTNDDIVKMIAAGLPESTIVQVIQKGPAAFDTSPDALIKLKRAGATSKIMEAMLGFNTSAPGPTATMSTPSERVAGSSNKGVYVQSTNGWKRIEEVSSIEVRAVGGLASQMTLGLKESRVICVFRGDRADMQTSERRPVFLITGLGASARDVYIVALRPNPDRRDLEMGRAGLLKKVSFGFRKRDVRDVEVKRLGDDLLEATPKQDLEFGEYIMVLGGAGMGRNSSAGVEGTTGFDFGIRMANSSPQP